MTRSIRSTVARAVVAAAMCAVVALGASGCSGAAAASTPATDSRTAPTLRLGYFDTVTHAPALAGLEQGFFTSSLGGTRLTTEVFKAGPAAIEALRAGAIDAAYLGPSPALSAFTASAGRALKIVAGATAGGAALVVRPGIERATDLRGATLATPQLGNTQDVALRTYLRRQGLTTAIGGGGEVTITPTENAQTLQLFRQGKLDGAWLPEPWVSRLVLEAGAHVLIDEKSQWPGGAFPTTVLAVNADYLAKHPDTVARLVAANSRSVEWLNTAGEPRVADVVNARLRRDTGKPLPDDVVARSLGEVAFDVDPLAATFPVLADHAVAAGLGKKAKLAGLFDLTALNAARAKAGEKPVSAAGLGAR